MKQVSNKSVILLILGVFLVAMVVIMASSPKKQQAVATGQTTSQPSGQAPVQSGTPVLPPRVQGGQANGTGVATPPAVSPTAERSAATTPTVPATPATPTPPVTATTPASTPADKPASASAQSGGATATQPGPGTRAANATSSVAANTTSTRGTNATSPATGRTATSQANGAQNQPQTPAKPATVAEPTVDAKAVHSLQSASLHFQGQGMVLRITAKEPFTCKSFALPSPDRLVVDLGGTWQNMQAPTVPGNNLVSKVRLGNQSGGPRLVLDLARALKSHELVRLSPTSVEIRMQ